ncbi:hypothetical protein PRIPAC_83784 [Pristionchus pacificus]|uniref:Uncharacterized protein n=1 Tax=Pristionchus pacificus TaxID=54126 RepID=A0A2A6BNQ0_PRIPA|nr:hypothetical protein PRIPAC_83784 [Pristionchus pacificus]|eukprot:PDM67446.1 hypothetical protein PRIPAC_48863 [Pristionchus pacificus]
MHCRVGPLSPILDAQEENTEELQAKLHALNQLIETDQITPSPNHRAPFIHSGISEDSDYTSDVNFPIHHAAGGNSQQPNSSVHQWDSHLRPGGAASRLHHERGGGGGPASSTGARGSFNDTALQASYEDEEDAYHSRMQTEEPLQPHHSRHYGDYGVEEVEDAPHYDDEDEYGQQEEEGERYYHHPNGYIVDQDGYYDIADTEEDLIPSARHRQGGYGHHYQPGGSQYAPHPEERLDYHVEHFREDADDLPHDSDALIDDDGRHYQPGHGRLQPGNSQYDEEEEEEYGDYGQQQPGGSGAGQYGQHTPHQYTNGSVRSGGTGSATLRQESMDYESQREYESDRHYDSQGPYQSDWHDDEPLSYNSRPPGSNIAPTRDGAQLPDYDWRHEEEEEYHEVSDEQHPYPDDEHDPHHYDTVHHHDGYAGDFHGTSAGQPHLGHTTVQQQQPPDAFDPALAARRYDSHGEMDDLGASQFETLQMMPQRRYDSSIGDSMAGLDHAAAANPAYHEPNGYHDPYHPDPEDYPDQQHGASGYHDREVVICVCF